MSWISGNRVLGLDEMENNALLIWDYFGSAGWSINAVSAMLGNMQTESYINPGIWESLRPYEGGYGLVQWTPYTKYSEWAGSSWQGNGYKQCQRIAYEFANGLQWDFRDPDYWMDQEDFPTSTANLDYLTQVFLSCYEGAAVRPQPGRTTQAQYWYNVLSGHEPEPPTPTGGNFPICLVKRVMKRRCR